MSFNTILINVNISNNCSTADIELTYGTDKFHYIQKSNNSYNIMVLDLDKFIDASYY